MVPRLRLRHIELAASRRIDNVAVLKRVGAGGPDSPLTIGEAAALVAGEMGSSRENERAVRNKVRTRIAAAMKRGAESGAPRIEALPSGLLTSDELVKWAKLTYPGVPLPLPRKPLEMSATGKVGVHASIVSHALPGSQERSHARIAKLENELRLKAADALRGAELQPSPKLRGPTGRFKSKSK